MNSEAAPPESAPAPAKPAGASHVRRRNIILGVVAVAILGSWLDARLSLSGLHGDLARRLADSDAQTKEARVAVQRMQDGVQTLQGRVAALEVQLAESQGQRLALEQMYQDLLKSRDERVIAEVEQAVSIAAQQLQLAGNVEAALIALSSADARLARVAGPQFLGARKLIARDIDRLRALPTADVPGMAVKLESIVASVDAMPLAFEQRPVHGGAVEPAKKSPSVTQPSIWERFTAETWAELRQLVRIERIDGAGAPNPALLSPSQSFFLRENLKLRLVNARLALLSHDARSFRDDTRLAREWLERHFDGRAKPVQAAVATLKTLGAANVAVEPPTLNETLVALRNFKTK